MTGPAGEQIAITEDVSAGPFGSKIPFGVSTVSWPEHGEIRYETKVFRLLGEYVDGYTRTYQSRDEAVSGHAEVVAEVLRDGGDDDDWM